MIWNTLTHSVFLFRPLPVEQQIDVENQAEEIINKEKPLQANSRSKELKEQDYQLTQNRNWPRVKLDYS